MPIQEQHPYPQKPHVLEEPLHARRPRPNGAPRADHRTHTPESLMTLKEVAALLRVSDWTLSRLVNTGALPTVRIGRRRLIAPADYASFIAAQREEFTRRGW